MANIKVMDEILSNKIAAGEVVERCVSVVKELVENSIDAKATEITINLQEAGTKEIRVIDNGKGMDHDDAVICFQRHATSKLLSEDDLFRINTLGFRGEALPSIASVSEVILKTSLGNVGTIVNIKGGIVKSIENGDSRIGTIMTVKDLFYNTPARLKHMKSLYTELANITEYVNKIALSYPNIKFTLTNNDSVILKTDGRSDLLKTIKDIYGLEVAKKMFKVSKSNNDYTINGYIGYPEVNRTSRNHMITIVNGRVVRNSELNRTINDSYHSYKPDNRYPIVVLEIDVDPSLIDVNIHPTKMDIKFSKMDSLIELIDKMIKEVLDKKIIVPVFESKKEDNEVIDNLNDKINEKHDYYESALNFNEVKEDEPYVLINEDLIVKHDHCDCEKEIVVEEEKEEQRFPKMYPVGLIHGTFIVCQNDTGMYLIDEHAAMERVNLEKIEKQMKQKKHDTIALLVPITMELTNAEYIILKQNMKALEELDIEVEEFGVNSIIIKSHPTWIKKDYEEVIIRRIIETIIKEESNFDIDKFLRSIMAMAACKMSVRANTNISLLEMQQIIDELAKCNNPFNCAHGRPTMIFYPNYELLKLFKRTGFDIKN
ncbi:MAG TPA: DNA mismatch repair endonuclease MutL [Bacilli bacterium]|nr:DNA mismatch repair endonuclease MutL [Bacilli bacterium]